MRNGSTRRKIRRWVLPPLVVLVAGGMSAGGYIWYRYFRPVIPPPVAPSYRYTCRVNSSGTSVTVPGLSLVAEISDYDDEIFSFMMYDYLRGRPLVRELEVFLTSESDGDVPQYRFSLLMPPDLLRALPVLEEMKRVKLAQYVRWHWEPRSTVLQARKQTSLFRAAYGYPAQRRLEQMSKAELAAFTRRFIRLKAVTDRRVLMGLSPVPTVPSPAEAQQLAHDIITVASFYDLPLDFFLGIGAMENNYMDVRGDLSHGVWKRRAERGDIVLRRRRGRVLVLNYASGVWQITRETLRLAHRLYLKDKRDYSQLPPRLRPPKKLNLDDVNSEVLTTYAGLLFRYLLDRFDGNVAMAVGAYNGGPGNPNMAYEEGVRRAAAYARRLLEQMSSMNGRAVADFLR